MFVCIVRMYAHSHTSTDPTTHGELFGAAPERICMSTDKFCTQTFIGYDAEHPCIGGQAIRDQSGLQKICWEGPCYHCGSETK